MTPPSEPRVTPEDMRLEADWLQDLSVELYRKGHTDDAVDVTTCVAMLRQGADAVERWEKLKSWPDRTVELEAEMALLEREP